MALSTTAPSNSFFFHSVPWGPWDPFSQLNEYFGTIRSIFTSVLESHNKAFIRVDEMRDMDGNVKSYTTLDDLDNEVRSSRYIIDLKTRNYYSDEPDYILAVKCYLVAIVTPIYTMGKIAWHTCKMPIEITKIASATLLRASLYSLKCQYRFTAIVIQHGCWKIFDSLSIGLFEIIKAPLFGVGLELAALYGICKPYHGRKFVANIDRAWQRGYSFREDMRRIIRPGDSSMTTASSLCDRSNPFFLAYCFQPRGNIFRERITISPNARKPLSPNGWVYNFFFSTP